MDSTHVAHHSLGVFESLKDYGVLGLAVLAFGYVAWFLIKRQLAEKDRLQKQLDELQNLK